MKRIIILDGQTLEDVALQAYGGVEGVAWLIEDNPGISWTSSLLAGEILLTREAAINRDLQAYYQSRGITPTTATTEHVSVVPRAFSNGFSNAFA